MVIHQVTRPAYETAQTMLIPVASGASQRLSTGLPRTCKGFGDNWVVKIPGSWRYTSGRKWSQKVQEISRAVPESPMTKDFLLIDPLQLSHLDVASEVSLRWASGLPGDLLSVARNYSLVLEHHHPGIPWVLSSCSLHPSPCFFELAKETPGLAS